MEYFYHGTGEGQLGLQTMIDIIESGGIKSKNKRNGTYYTLFNGDDHISVCKWCYEDTAPLNATIESSFYGWIFNLPCFIIDESIEAIHARKIERPYSYDPNKERVSQFIDEWHVRDEISLDKIVGIALPFCMIRESRQSLRMILRILEYAKLYGWKVYSSDLNLIENVNKDNVIYGGHSFQKRAQE